MSFVTNISAMNALNQRRLIGLNEKAATERLSSGLRINKGADDPSGLGISAGMKSRVRGAHQAMANAQDGLRMMGVMDAGLAEIQDMLMRMRDLSVRAANEATLTDRDRDKLHDEARSLRDAIDQIAKTTKYNTKDLLYVDGDYRDTDEIKLANNMSFVALSGDGGKVVFTENGDLYIANGDGTGKRQLTNSLEYEFALENTISHDGTRLIFMSDQNLYSMESNGTSSSLIESSFGISEFILSGDGKKIIYSMDGDIYVADFDGRNKIRLTNNPLAIEYDLALDERATKLTFSRTGATVHVINTDGSDELQISPPLSGNSFLTENGNEIIFANNGNLMKSSVDGTNPQILTINLSGTDLTNTFLVYRNAFTSNLFVFDINSQTFKQITFSSTSNNFSQISADSNRSAYNSLLFEPYIKLANITDEQVLQIGPDNGTPYRMPVDVEDMGSGSLGVWGVTLTRTDGALAAITKIDDAVEKVSTKRAHIGELQRRIGHVIDDLTAQGINTDASRSRIEDADVALEMTDLVKEQLKDASNLEAVTLAHDISRADLNLIEQQIEAAA